MDRLGHFWGLSGIVLGSWELAAYVSRGRIPTVSSVVWSCRVRNERAVRVAVFAWSVGLCRHLLGKRC